MTEKILMARTPLELRLRVNCWRLEGLRVGLVPTMGALHEGHLSLVRKARAHADKTVASIFVNPKQFAPGEDLSVYPRQVALDAALLAGEGCTMVYAPAIEDIYPPDFVTSVRVGGLTDILCGKDRPGHFDGVATIVLKLLNQCQPDFAVFGEKDYQQLLMIRRMVKDLDLPVEINSHRVVRAEDGLALSSRNAYLSQEERNIAPRLYDTLRHTAASLREGAASEDARAEAARLLGGLGFKLDYLEVRHKADLSPAMAGPLLAPEDHRLFVAAHLGKTRLIDNIAIVF